MKDNCVPETCIPICQFVAFSNTGKTTFLEKLVSELKSRGLRLCVYKHDGHDFEVDKPGKDTWRMTQAGADVTVISSASKAVIMENHPVPPEELVARITGVDLILVEGYKKGPWAKIALRRQANGKNFPVDPADCLAVISDTPCPEAKHCFGLNDIIPVADFLVKVVIGDGNSVCPSSAQS